MCLKETHRNEVVAAFLAEFTDAFPHSADNLGRTSIVKHEMLSNGNKPINQNPRRLPISQLAVAEVGI